MKGTIISMSSAFMAVVVAERAAELGMSVGVSLLLGVIAAGVGYIVYKMFADLEKEKRRQDKRKEARRRTIAERERRYRTANAPREKYIPPEERLMFEERKPLAAEKKPVRKICGALAEDFGKLPEDERRAFFT